VLATLWIIVAALVVALVLSATANLGLRTRSVMNVARHLEEEGRGEDLRWLTSVRDDLSLATATLRTIASLALVLNVVAMCERYGLGGTPRAFASFGISFVLIMVFGVAVPSALAKYATDAVIRTAFPFFGPLHFVSRPVLRALQGIDSIMRRVIGVPAPTTESQNDLIEQEILNMVSEGEVQGAVDRDEKKMIESVMEFADTDVEDIMTPRTDIHAIDKTTSLDDARAFIVETGHSRIPVYDDTIDNILGVLYAKDLLRIQNDAEFDITKTIRTVPYIPDNKPVNELLQELKEKKIHMAIVLDEYGGTSGLVTIEDIIEELVGDIADEYEPNESEPFVVIDDATVEIDARTRIDDVNEELRIDLPSDEEFDTLGGFVFSSMGRIPDVGEQVRHKNVTIKVIDAEPRRINRLRILIDSQPKAKSGDNGSE
jgi:magnesium and cobalt exporter, CNNM family